MNRVTHTIRRAAGGSSHFARVTVSLDNEVKAVPSNDISPDWIAAAEAGVEHALSELHATKSKVSVVEVQGTVADTREDTLFVASAIATFKILGDSRFSEAFKDSAWEVRRMES